MIQFQIFYACKGKGGHMKRSLLRARLAGYLAAVGAALERAFVRYAEDIAAVHECLGPNCWPPYV